MERRDKHNYYLDIAEQVAERGTCLRRNYGSVIVNNDEIVSSGYTGSPRGRANCSELGFCMRQKMGIPRGERYELCRSVHSEANAIISAARKDMIDATLYLCGVEMEKGDYVKDASCCSMCKRLVINAGIKTVVVRNTKNEYTVVDVQSWIDHDDSMSEIFGY